MWQVGSRTVSLGLGLWQKYPYRRLVDLVAQAEDAGYDVLWCGNEKFYRDMWVTTGLVAAHVRRAQVGTFIAEPYSYHPAMIAAAIATVDEATNGRAILLLGAGGVGFPEMGLIRRQPVAAVRETIDIVRRLLAGEEVTFEGKVISVTKARLAFEARPDLPIWVASRGNNMLRMAGSVADGVMIATYATPAGIRAGMEQVAANGIPPDFPVTVRVDVALDDDAETARAAVRPMIAGMIKASYPNTDFIKQAGLEMSSPVYEELTSHDFDNLDCAAKYVPDSFVDAFAWAGEPQQVAERMAAVLDMGIERVTFLPHMTATNSVDIIVKRFASEVMPQVQALMRG